MAEYGTPVYVQLPGDIHKSLVGELVWNSDTKVGSFTYDKSYYKLEGAYPLDPTALRSRPRKETRNDGIYGVLRDAGPDAWGRDQLMRIYGSLNEIDTLLHAPQDGAGNITFHEEQRLRVYSLQEIDEVSAGFPPGDTAIASAVNQTTSMGGAKPKLLAYDDGAFWIVKFPEKGDPEFKSAGNEHAMLVMARECGIDSAESRVHLLPDGRRLILVKRFDLFGTPSSFTRLGFASAHTVLGMGNPRKNGELKSYPLLRHQARLWTQKEIGLELWQRLIFNALVANGDDHARNHAFVHDEQWVLAKVFDIVANPGFGPVCLCLQIHTGSVIATPESLLVSAEEMGIERDQAIHVLKTMSRLVLGRWYDLVAPNMSTRATNQLQTAFRLSEDVLRFDFASIPAHSKRKRY